MKTRAGRLRLLVPIDGSRASLRALDYIANSPEGAQAEILLLNVRPGRPKGDAAEAQRAIGESLMRPAMLRLDAKRIDYAAEVAFGPLAETILEQASKRRCHAICVSTKDDVGTLKRFVGSLACNVLRPTEIAAVAAAQRSQ